MRKVLLFTFASLISFIAFAQHVEYYPTSQRYYMVPYHKPNVLNFYDSNMSYYPFLNGQFDDDSHYDESDFIYWRSIYNYNFGAYYGHYRIANKCIVANMSGRAIYGIAVPIILWTVPRNYVGSFYPEHFALISDSVSEETERAFDSAWNNMIDIIQQRTELYPWYRLNMWLLRPTGSETNQSWLIDSVSAIPEWNMITDSKFRFPNLWIDDSIHEYLGNEPYLTFPTVEVYFEQPYIVSDSFIVASDFYGGLMYSCNDTFCRGLSTLSIRTSYAENHFRGEFSLVDNYGYPHYTDHYITNPYDSVYTSLMWKGIFPILVPPSGCYKPYDVRASVIGYDSAVVEWMSRFWLPESRVEYGHPPRSLRGHRLRGEGEQLVRQRLLRRDCVPLQDSAAMRASRRGEPLCGHRHHHTAGLVLARLGVMVRGGVGSGGLRRGRGHSATPRQPRIHGRLSLPPAPAASHQLRRACAQLVPPQPGLLPVA